MKTRSWIIGIVAMGSFIFAGNLSWADGRHGDRHENHHGRIEHGVRRVGINTGEHARLNSEHTYIYREKVVAWSDGCRDRGRRHPIEKMHNRPSFPIYHAQCNYGHGPGKHHKQCVPVRHSPPCRQPSYPVALGSFISGLIVQPGWAVGWTVGLDGP